MLTIPIKEPWFSMILSGEKKEEYRERKLYWQTRLQSAGLLGGLGHPTEETRVVCFRNGYGKSRPSFLAEVWADIDIGRPEWGAEKGKTYYVLRIEKVWKVKP